MSRRGRVEEELRDHLERRAAELRAGGQAQLAAISARLARAYPASNASVRARALPLHQEMTQEVSASLWMVFAAVTLLLLIVCVNLANLLLARTAARGEELAVRAALGASGGGWRGNCWPRGCCWRWWVARAGCALPRRRCPRGSPVPVRWRSTPRWWATRWWWRWLRACCFR